MRDSFWGYWFILLGIFVIGVMILVNNTTTGTTQDYYLLKEVTQAAMIDSIDYSYYRVYGDMKMSKKKFTENFIRRFSESDSLSKDYKIEFYDIYEVPPKVSVKVSSVGSGFNIANDPDTSFDLVNKIDAILVWTNGSNNPDPDPEFGGSCGNFEFIDSFVDYVLNCIKNPDGKCVKELVQNENGKYNAFYDFSKISYEEWKNDPIEAASRRRYYFAEAFKKFLGHNTLSYNEAYELVNNDPLFKYGYTVQKSINIYDVTFK